MAGVDFGLLRYAITCYQEDSYTFDTPDTSFVGYGYMGFQLAPHEETPDILNLMISTGVAPNKDPDTKSELDQYVVKFFQTVLLIASCGCLIDFLHDLSKFIILDPDDEEVTELSLLWNGADLFWGIPLMTQDFTKYNNDVAKKAITMFALVIMELVENKNTEFQQGLSVIVTKYEAPIIRHAARQTKH